jgi:hypothetical protein
VVFLLIDDARIFHEYALRQHDRGGVELFSLGLVIDLLVLKRRDLPAPLKPGRWSWALASPWLAFVIT